MISHPCSKSSHLMSPWFTPSKSHSPDCDPQCSEGSSPPTALKWQLLPPSLFTVASSHRYSLTTAARICRFFSLRDIALISVSTVTAPSQEGLPLYQYQMAFSSLHCPNSAPHQFLTICYIIVFGLFLSHQNVNSKRHSIHVIIKNKY